MFRKMRRSGQMLSQAENIAILNQETAGVLALVGDDGYPYGVPLSYVFHAGKLYFHGAKEGHKIDAIRNCAKASFCVIGRDQVIPEEYTTSYRSVIAFGTVRILEDVGEIQNAVRLLALKYHPGDSGEHRQQVIADGVKRCCVLELSIDHLTGKRGRS